LTWTAIVSPDAQSLDSTRNKSLFASFSSEKEDSCSFSEEKTTKKTFDSCSSGSKTQDYSHNEVKAHFPDLDATR
jgi:hypothetical protein